MENKDKDLSQRVRESIREVPDFPIEGVLFKDISPLFLDPQLVDSIRKRLIEKWSDQGITKVVGIDSRGFLFGPQMAVGLDAGFVMVRKKGKLPPETVSVSYELEYGSATLESVVGGLELGDKVVIHDDLLATGGTAAAAAQLIKELGGEVAGFSFLIDLSFLNGKEKLLPYSDQVDSLVVY
ncbi:MAG: adenine phosphoribosyltransferase [Bacteroidota bacterium]